MADRQRTQDQAVDDSKNGRIRTDAENEGKESDD
jgi:hypothetical protein